MFNDLTPPPMTYEEFQTVLDESSRHFLHIAQKHVEAAQYHSYTIEVIPPKATNQYIMIVLYLKGKLHHWSRYDCVEYHG